MGKLLGGIAALILLPVLIVVMVTGMPLPATGSGPCQAVTAVSVAAASSPGPAPPWTQAQMTAAVAKYDPAQAQVLGAIAMAETGGRSFPSINPTGVYHGPWAFQEAANPGLDFHRLDTDLDYAARQAAQLASTGITHQKWETWPAAAQEFLHGPASGVDGAALTGAGSSTAACTGSGSAGMTAVSAAGVADSNAVVVFAKTLIGSPYRPPYYDPSGFSCDGFVWYVFRHFGIDLPRGATNQLNAVQRLPDADAAQPGDVVGFHQDGPSAGNPQGLEFHHIGLVVGPDLMIDALGSAYGVRVDHISAVDTGPGHYVRYGRVLRNLNPADTP